MTTEPTANAAAHARALLELRRPRDAIPLIQQAIASDPKDADNYCLLSVALDRAGDLAGSETAAREAIALQPDEEWGHRLLSMSLLAQGRARDALAPALASRQLAPHYSAPYVNLVPIALAIPDMGLAQLAASDLLTLAPEDSTSHIVAGEVELQLRHYRLAVDRFTEAVRLDPLDVIAHNELGIALMRSGDRAGALRAFQAAAQLDPGDRTSADNIRQMARQDKLPLPTWARIHPIVYGPAFLVAIVRKAMRRQHYDRLPEAARRDVLRWTIRDVVTAALAVLSGLASLVWLGTFTGPDIVTSLHKPALATGALCYATLWVLRRRGW